MDSQNIVTHTVEGETYSDCIRRIQEIHSSNYNIIGKRQITYGGFLGLFQKQGIEVKFTLTKTPVQMNSYPPRSPYQQQTKIDDFDEERKKILDKTKVTLQPGAVQNIIEALSKMEDKISKVTSAPEEHPTVSRILNLLEQNDFSSQFIRIMSERMKKTCSLSDLEDYDSVQERVVEWIAESISIHTPSYTAKPQIIILVGPTGVGKTTTIAKLAARFVTAQDNSPKAVSIITVDSYRIAAVDQIKVYGEHMDIPVSLAENNEDVKKLIDMHSTDVDVILIDTIGYSPKDFDHIGNMRQKLNLSNYAVETYLTMSASTKLSDMKEIMSCYEIFSYDSIIITKFDETDTIGNVISALSEKNKPVTYVTTGQAVPRFFEDASISGFLSGLKGFKFNKQKIEQKIIQDRNI
ncbi:MAG TPA: flagellar biosynthesis protein FlhF [Treponemataceae bacterium]|nr:flagellar biosynthesis protein FlhF [Treponemataceae bacterium]